jgi:hypothetical protein
MEKAAQRLNLDTDDEPKSRLVPTIILIVLPGILFVWLDSNWTYNPVPIHGKMNISTIMIPTMFIVIGISIGSIVYGLTALRNSTGNSFKNRTVIEFEYVKKIIVVEISLITVYLVTQFIPGSSGVLRYYFDYLPPYIPWTFAFLGRSLLLVVPGGLLWIILHVARKEFRFYFAKACFLITSKEKDDYKKVRYLLMGLNSYNKYLRRKLSLEIKDIEKIYSKFVYAETTEKREIIQSVCESVEAADRLKLARYLSFFSKIPETELFVSEALTERLKTIGTALAAVIPIIISAIDLYIKNIQHGQ